MPAIPVKKQLPTKGLTPTNKPGSLLSRVQPVATRPDRINVSLYGRSKTGKTRLMASFPKPCILIGAEDGTASIIGIKGIDFVRVILDDWEPPKNGAYVRISELSALLEEIESSGKYKSKALDTASALSDLFLADILGLSKVPEQKSWGMAQRDHYTEQSNRLRTFMRQLLNIPGNTIITAHERNFTEENNSSDLIKPTVGSALSASVAGWLNGAVDYVAQTFIREEESTRKVAIPGKKGETRDLKTKTGRAEYCLRIGPHPVYQTGFRLPPGFSLPDVIVDPSYEKIMEVIEGKHNG